MNDFDCLIIGAGVVGLAVARALALQGLEVIVVEREPRFGLHTSSRNSEVIHAGIHYAKGSLKAQLCVQGRERLYQYCQARDIAHRRCGKLTVATSEAQEAGLIAIDAAARANQVCDLTWLEGGQVRRLEPALRCRRALLSPSTGIIDAQGYMLALIADAQSAGAILVYNTAVTGIATRAEGFTVSTDEASHVKVRRVVNAAGPWAHQVAASMVGLAPEHIPTVYFAKGNYFALPGAAPFSRLVYPVGEHGWLGIHATLDLGGAIRFGPDLQWSERIDYSVDCARAAQFYDAVRRYWPALPEGALVPGYAGVRAKLAGPGEPAADFLISGPAEHGLAGLINLFGIESPGLTASLALADAVAAALV